MPSPHGRSSSAMPPRKASRENGRARTKTDTGGQVENTKAIGRTLVKELGKMAPHFGRRGASVVKSFADRSSRPQRNGPSDCLQKHRPLLSRKTTYRG